MNLSNLFKVVAGTGLLVAATACSPTQKNTLEMGTQSSSIIGGAPVELTDDVSKSTVAIVATVLDKNDQEGQFICTGSLLNANVVLTAGHCVPTVGQDFKKVALYVVFNTDLKKMQRSDVRLVVDQVVHPEYGKVGQEGEDAHDLALVKFTGAMAANYKLAKFLDDESLLKPGTKVTLAGYGLNETDGVNTKSDDRLYKVDVEVAEEFGKHEILLDQTKGKGACHGDSGGPAFLDVNGTSYVWGVTSRGAGKDGKDDCSLVSVYTKVKSESAFVNEALNKLSQKK